MHITEDCKEIGIMNKELMKPVTEILAGADWSGKEYDRTEVTLQGGKLLVLPFLTPFTKPAYTPAQQKLLDVVAPLVEKVMEQFPRYIKIRGEVATLLPGIKVRLHYDDRWFHANCRRIHVPLVTNDKCEQHFENRKYHLDYGKIYEINNRMLHGAANYGDEPRVHLIIDLLDEDLYNSYILPDKSRLNEIIVPEQFRK